MPLLVYMCFLRVAAAAVLLASEDEELFQLVEVRQFEPESVTELLAEYPDPHHCVAATLDGRTYIYDLRAADDQYADPLPFDYCQNVCRISSSRIGFLSRESAIAWENSSQTARRLRRKQSPIASASVLACHADAGVLTLVDADGVSVWSSESLEEIWAPEQIPDNIGALCLYDATTTSLIVGDVLGNVWKFTPEAPMEKVRNSEFSGLDRVTPEEMFLLRRVVIDLALVDETLVAILFRDSESSYVEWWSNGKQSNEQVNSWNKVMSVSLVMDAIAAKSCGTGDRRRMYISSNYAICRVNLASQGSNDCIVVSKDASPITCFSVSPDQSMILTGHQNGTVRIWRNDR
jgi:WD40 repeat protein